MLPENGSPKLDWTFKPPKPASAGTETAKDSEAAIILFVFKVSLH